MKSRQLSSCFIAMAILIAVAQSRVYDRNLGGDLGYSNGGTSRTVHNARHTSTTTTRRHGSHLGGLNNDMYRDTSTLGGLNNDMYRDTSTLGGLNGDMYSDTNRVGGLAGDSYTGTGRVNDVTRDLYTGTDRVGESTRGLYPETGRVGVQSDSVRGVDTLYNNRERGLGTSQDRYSSRVL